MRSRDMNHIPKKFLSSTPSNRGLVNHATPRGMPFGSRRWTQKTGRAILKAMAIPESIRYDKVWVS